MTRPSKLRYFIVGEYGEKTFRPHYHAALFNFPECQNGTTKTDLHGKPIPEKCCQVCQLLYKTWGLGITYSAPLNDSTAQYICGYVTKKMTHRQDPRLAGRDPEFARMSLKPGLGLDMMHEAASAFLEHDLEQSESDVPVTLRHGSRMMPLGRYLRKNLRKMVGRDEKTPPEILAAQQKEMLSLYASKLNDPSFVSIKTALVEKDKGTNWSQSGKAKLYKQVKKL